MEFFKSNNIINDAPSFIASFIKIIADNENSFDSSNVGLLIKKMLLAPLVKNQLLTQITSANISTADITIKVEELKTKVERTLTTSSSSSSNSDDSEKLAYALMYCKSVGSGRQYTPIITDAEVASTITDTIQLFWR
ncbi:hypothetical protein FACS1894122_12760 [Alphaproteobacteria bacterium]|nr:hypothetical protein FACS1894122_12760 [Alphaproteobacteria bacterium]